MGNTSTKLAEKCTLLSKDEVPIVAGSFKFVSKNSDRIKEDDLMKIWGSQMDARLAQYIANFLFGPPSGGGGAAGDTKATTAANAAGTTAAARLPHAGFQRFAELYVFCVRGTIDERISVMLASMPSVIATTTVAAAATSGTAGTPTAAQPAEYSSNSPAAAVVQDEGDAHYEISYPLVKEFVEAVVSSYIRAIRLQGGAEYKSWESRGFHFVHECVQKLAESLSHELLKLDTQKVTRSDIDSWLQQNPTFLCMFTHVFLHLYHYRSTKSSQQQQQQNPHNAGSMSQSANANQQQLQSHDQQVDQLQRETDKNTRDTASAASQRRNNAASELLPTCEGLLYTPDYPACTDISQIMFINAALPQQMRHKWRFLFSAQIHGESFSTLLGRILDQGPSVLIVEDADGCIFGGYASAAWSLGPKFVGDETAFAFTLRPRMRVFPTTGFNRNYQYLNLHQQTMPNGLGMGGQHNYWGIWLDSDYGNGECSESCTTFRNYTQLSAKKNFTIRNLEVWGVGDKPLKEDIDGPSERSVLDGNLEEKAILEMAGRSQYSEGYRDEPLE